MKSNISSAFLAEMDIQEWQLAHPEKLQGYQQPEISLDGSVKLLFVSPQVPSRHYAEFLQKVLKAMQLDLDDCRHLYPNQIQQLGAHSLQWLWFSDCVSLPLDGVKLIASPALSEIDGNNQNRRQLWNQIQANA
ncbi:DNA polymerase III subunit psi [Vibrio inusitatus NBRC 102082]|uniref:DNA polymerase III subunit psi n=1 Tax=Vibrio inusitatus NBRC 102082 TaxID=1219070 RepID=A0A4Y3HWI3_9VIBR|nr:DNA polymerase III subunit psi [Vibrio inusitatus]GEA51080.1 DNA polymerase III subunit psi [Vibrio inusitatus NBRC 102082]